MYKKKPWAWLRFPDTPSLPRFSNVCRLRIIKTRTELGRGRPGTEATLTASDVSIAEEQGRPRRPRQYKRAWPGQSRVRNEDGIIGVPVHKTTKKELQRLSQYQYMQ